MSRKKVELIHCLMSLIISGEFKSSIEMFLDGLMTGTEKHKKKTSTNRRMQL